MIGTVGDRVLCEAGLVVRRPRGCPNAVVLPGPTDPYHVNLTGPSGVVKQGNDLAEHRSGPPDHGRLAVYRSTQKCKKPNHEEYVKGHRARPIVDESPAGSFSFRIRLRAAETGNFVACAYLVQHHSPTFDTESDAKAS